MNPKKRVALLINLGTPDDPSIKSVRRYLFEFLMDKNVINGWYPFRLMLVGGIIVLFRAPNSSKSYKEMWDKKNGSPLLSISQALQKKVQQKSNHSVFLAMRYGNPSIKNVLMQALKALEMGGEREIFCIPLYPQYAMSTTKSVIEKTQQELMKMKKKYPQYADVTIRFKETFYKDPLYLKALQENIRPLAEKMKKSTKSPEKILFSYHGIPVHHVKATDPTKMHCYQKENCCAVENKTAQDYCYRKQCLDTTETMIKDLNLDRKRVMTTFQSRLGRYPWLEPYTDKVIEKLAKDGIKNIAVCSPAFVSDNLETLFELEIENKEIFINNGGEQFEVNPCLNTSPLWVNAIANWINQS